MRGEGRLFSLLLSDSFINQASNKSKRENEETRVIGWRESGKS